MTTGVVDMLLPLCSTEEQKLVLETLHNAEKGTRITRGNLKEILHKTDRETRRIIMSMRKAGIPIASSTDRSGYYLPSTMAEYLDFAQAYKSKARTIYDIEKKMSSTFFNIYSGQIEVEEDGTLHDITQ